MTVYRLSESIVFPDPNEADPSGLLAVGGDLSPQRLLLAYASGIFPWFSGDEPLLWWSPDPRLVIWPARLRLDRDSKRAIRQQRYQLRFDTRFEQVVESCARAPRQGQQGTWITPAMQMAYSVLHKQGWAHSVEVWRDDKLCGGLYGIAMGGCFFGESMFSVEKNTSKIALNALAQKFEGGLIDGQVDNPHLRSLGGQLIRRPEFLRIIKKYVSDADLWSARS